MLQRSRLPTILRTVPVFGRRSVYVLSYEKRKKNHKKPDPLKRWAEKDDLRKDRLERDEYKRRLNELRLLSKNVAQYVKQRRIQEEEAQKLKDMPLPSQIQTERKSEFDASTHSLDTMAVALPHSIEEKLGLAVKYLVSKENQNWSLVLHQLQDGGGVAGVPEKDIRKMIYAIPRNQLRQVFPQIEQLLADANLAKSPKIINAYLKSVIAGTVSNEDILILEKYVAEIRQTSRKGKLPRETLELLVEAYGKANNVAQMESAIKEMKRLGLEPSPKVYSNVLSTCVYKTRDHKQAVQLFDLMKFLAGSMAPSTREYQDIIVSYVNNDDIEKALDLYQEMLTNRIDINQNIMVALARGCMSRPQLKFKAWDFMFDIYNSNLVPTVPTLEYMLFLAARDGDLALARAFYQQLNLSNATSARSFSFLLIAYSACSISNPQTEFKPLAITVSETGRNFRRNILDLADFTPKLDNPAQAVPFLPKIALTTSEELLAELSAIMAHTLMAHPEYVNTASVNRFLSIAASVGSLEDFKDRFDQFTYLDTKGIPATRTEDPDISEALDSLKEHERSSTKSPVLEHVAESGNNTFKTPRDTLTYILALKAASRGKNYMFAQRIWKERGDYRQSESFRKLSREAKDRLDFHFATSMVKCLTDLRLLEDALAILVSTEYQFKWTWKELKTLYAVAANIGHENITRTIRGVVKRAQINHEGKIRKKDYKQYVLERGY